VLSNIDWVIAMLRQVRQEKPQAATQWWESLRRDILDSARRKRGDDRKQ
jgi:hypothetical protein